MEFKRLNKDEQLSFRDDFKEKEKEIQRYIGIYLSSLVVAAGWLLRPDAEDLLSLSMGNHGYNLYAVQGVIAVNVLFTAFLIYKSLIIHEIMQFISVFGNKDDSFGYWEWWRRNEYSATKRAKTIYFALIAILPLFVSFASLYFLGTLIFSDSFVSRVQATGMTIEESRSMLSGVQFWFIVLVLLHAVPIWFLVLHQGPVMKLWKKIAGATEPEGIESFVDKLLKKADRGEDVTSSEDDTVSNEEP